MVISLERPKRFTKKSLNRSENAALLPAKAQYGKNRLQVQIVQNAHQRPGISVGGHAVRWN